MGMTSREALDAAEVAYGASQDALFAWQVAVAEGRADKDDLYRVHEATWHEYLRLVNMAAALVRAEQVHQFVFWDGRST